jgi:uroporphyrinogen decarboxylase
MTDEMDHQERVRAALRGEDVDRPPVSMWRHFYVEETSPDGLADAMLGFQRRYDWDFMKLNPRASYHAEDWGLKMRYSGDDAPQAVGWPIQQPEDWLELEVLDPNRGVLGEHLGALDTIARGLDSQVPILMTVFTPLSIAARLAPSEEVFMSHLRENGESVKHALEVVTETFVRFATACLERGAGGLFYATTSWATTDMMTREEYTRYARPYDLKLLDALPECEFNLLHVCKENNMLADLADYPVHAFNWDSRSPTNLSLAPGKALLGGKTVVGGLDNGTELIEAAPEELAWEARGIRSAMGDEGWMLGTGCTFKPETPEANVRAIRDAAGGILVP